MAQVFEGQVVGRDTRTDLHTQTDLEAPLPFPELEGPAFPLTGLPDDFVNFVYTQAKALQVPVGMVATLAHGVIGGAAAGRCEIRLRPDWVEPLNVFVVAVLPSGERKSPTFRELTRPLENREAELIQNAASEIADMSAELEIVEKRLSRAKEQTAKATTADEQQGGMIVVRELAQEAARISVPTLPRMLADDATPEAVASLLADNDGRATIASTEGGIFETIAGRYSEGVPNLDIYLKGYSGDTVRIDRKSRASEHVPNPALTLVLTVQPEILKAMTQKKMFRGRGFLSRWLYEIRHSLVGYREIDPPPVPEPLRRAWDRTINAILTLPFPAEGEEHALELSPEALQSFNQFRGSVEERLRPGAEFADIADWANKMPGHVARLAGGLHLWQHAAAWKNGGPLPWTVQVSQEVLEAAIGLGEYYAEHAAVAFAMMLGNTEIEEARRLWLVIDHAELEEFTVRDLWQKARRRYGSVEDMKAALETLSQLHYLHKATDTGRVGPGRPRSDRYSVNPLAKSDRGQHSRTQCTQNTQNPADPSVEPKSVDSVYARGPGRTILVTSFESTHEWQELPDGMAVPDGLETKTESASGRSFARLPQTPTTEGDAYEEVF